MKSKCSYKSRVDSLYHEYINKYTYLYIKPLKIITNYHKYKCKSKIVKYKYIHIFIDYKSDPLNIFNMDFKNIV